MSNDIRVSFSFAVDVVGDGEPSDSGWEFGSECDSVAVSGVLLLLLVRVILFFVVTLMCEDVLSYSE